MINKINGKKIDFHQLLEYSPLAHFVIKDQKIVYGNKSCLGLLKLSKPEDLLFQDISQFIHPAFYDHCLEQIKQAKNNQGSKVPDEIKVIDSLGNLIDVAILIDVFYFDDEILTQAILTDISERKENQKLLMQSEKIAVIGELAMGIVHEIRNPLTILKGFLSLMELGESFPTNKEDYITIMKREIERIESLANDLLYFSKPHEQNVSPEKMVKLVEYVIFLLEPAALKKEIKINAYYMDKDIVILCDPNQIKQALINLIKNAIEATPYQGKIDVIIQRKNDKVNFTITDTGCGIPKEKLHQLGTSFFSTKENGTGLGLMITNNIIKNHSGHITVESEEGRGTTFTIDLPSLP